MKNSLRSGEYKQQLLNRMSNINNVIAKSPILSEILMKKYNKKFNRDDWLVLHYSPSALKDRYVFSSQVPQIIL